MQAETIAIRARCHIPLGVALAKLLGAAVKASLSLLFLCAIYWQSSNTKWRGTLRQLVPVERNENLRVPPNVRRHFTTGTSLKTWCVFEVVGAHRSQLVLEVGGCLRGSISVSNSEKAENGIRTNLDAANKQKKRRGKETGKALNLRDFTGLRFVPSLSPRLR